MDNDGFLKSKDIKVGEIVYVLAKITSSSVTIWRNHYVPTLVEKEFKYFFVGKVVPHKIPDGWGMSNTYYITINKFDLDSGELLVKANDT